MCCNILICQSPDLNVKPSAYVLLKVDIFGQMSAYSLLQRIKVTPSPQSCPLLTLIIFECLAKNFYHSLLLNRWKLAHVCTYV